MNISSGVAETTLCVTGADQPPADADLGEPDWMPVWTVDGDDAAWIAKGKDGGIPWEVHCQPDYGMGDIWVYRVQLGHSQSMTLTEPMARALRHALGEWLQAREATR